MRVVTYNTRGSLGMDNVRSTERIADTLRSLSADIICLQEIHQRLIWSDLEDQPVVLARMLGRTFTFLRTMTFGFGGYGLGICTRGIPIARREHLLPGGREPRGVLEVRLRAACSLRNLTVLCTHWGLNAGERQQQAEACIALLRTLPPPVVFCGDFNQSLDSPLLHKVCLATGLRDADSPSRHPTFVSTQPSVRIDGILHSPCLVPTHAEIVSSQASDHLPLLVDFLEE